MTIATVTHADPTADLPLARRSAPPTTLAGLALRTPFWVFSGALAVIFLFPLVWTSVASVSPHPGTGQVDGRARRRAASSEGIGKPRMRGAFP